MARKKRRRKAAGGRRQRRRNPVGAGGWGYPGFRPRTLMDVEMMDGIAWTRPVGSSGAWRPVRGERGQHARSIAEATRVLRYEGYRVRRRRTGNPSRGPRRRNPAGMPKADANRLFSRLRKGDKVVLSVAGRRAATYTVTEPGAGRNTVVVKRFGSRIALSPWDFAEGHARLSTSTMMKIARRNLRRARRRTSNFASGMRYIHNLPPRARTTRWMANPTSPRLRRAGPRKGRPAWTRRGAGSLSGAQRSLLNWMNRNGGISDGKVTTQTAAVRRALGALHRRGLVRKSGRTGKNARYTLTTKGFHALGNVKGVRVKRVSRRKKR